MAREGIETYETAIEYQYSFALQNEGGNAKRERFRISVYGLVIKRGRTNERASLISV